jgi:ATP-dependent helicase/nuclease subunit B
MGRFDADALPELDRRPTATSGDQFNYSKNKDGSLGKNGDGLASAQFMALLDHVEEVLIQMGRDIYAGIAKVDPFRKGNVTACDHCDYRAVCRIDPWTHTWRVLKKSAVEDRE